MDPVERLATTSGLAVRSPPDALAAWQAVLVGARRAWPTLRIDEDKLAAFVGPRLVGSDVPGALAAAAAGDLAIAAMCDAQEPTAHAAFDSILTEVSAAGASTRAPAHVVDEVKQLLRLQLLVPRDGKPPGIAGYRGKGPLRGWVRITATREIIRQLKKQRRETALEPSLEDALGAQSDPMLSQLKAEYRSEFATSLKEAIAALSAEDRTLLRQSIVEQLSIDAIGAAFGVHRATAARWLSRARAALVTETRTKLAKRLAMPVEQIDSVIRLVQSRLDASIVRHLRDN